MPADARKQSVRISDVTADPDKILIVFENTVRIFRFLSLKFIFWQLMDKKRQVSTFFRGMIEGRYRGEIFCITETENKRIQEVRSWTK